MMKKFERVYARNHSEISDGDYFSIPKSEFPNIKYTDVSKHPHQDIYLMRRFKDSEIENLFLNDLDQDQIFYRENGYLILRDFIPHDIIDNYLSLRNKLNLGRDQLPQHETPHVKYKEINDILCYKPLSDVIEKLHHMKMGLIFGLTGFKSTQRGWHQDSYLDHDNAMPRCASWVALGDVNESCGPFEFIPGSNRWDALSNKKINNYLKEDYHWPIAHRTSVNGSPRWGRISESFLDDVVYDKVEEDKCDIHQFIAKKGDVLIWYGRLMHRGMPPENPDAVRPSLIGHYAPLGEKGRGLFKVNASGSFYLVPPGKSHF